MPRGKCLTCGRRPRGNWAVIDQLRPILPPVKTYARSPFAAMARLSVRTDCHDTLATTIPGAGL